MKNITQKISKTSVYSKEKSNELGEVFTPPHIIEQMCDSLSPETWADKKKKFLDPCAGKGNMPAILINRLMEGLKDEFKDEFTRYKHIMENQIYMCEIQRESAKSIIDTFDPEGQIKINLYVGDTLSMPEDFFDLTYEERQTKYKDDSIVRVIQNTKIDPNAEWLSNLIQKAKQIRLNKPEPYWHKYLKNK